MQDAVNDVSTPRGSNRGSHVDDYSVPTDNVIGPPSNTAGDYHHLNPTTMEAPRIHDYTDLRGPPYYNVPVPVAAPRGLAGRPDEAGNKSARSTSAQSSTTGDYHHLDPTTMAVPQRHDYADLRGPPYYNVPTPVAGPNGRTNTAGNEGAGNDDYQDLNNQTQDVHPYSRLRGLPRANQPGSVASNRSHVYEEIQ